MKTMTSDDKTLAFLARRVGAGEEGQALEVSSVRTRDDILGNQQVFLPVVQLLAEVPLVLEEVKVSSIERQRIYDAVTTNTVKMTKCIPPCFEEGHGI